MPGIGPRLYESYGIDVSNIVDIRVFKKYRHTTDFFRDEVWGEIEASYGYSKAQFKSLPIEIQGKLWVDAFNHVTEEHYIEEHQQIPEEDA